QLISQATARFLSISSIQIVHASHECKRADIGLTVQVLDSRRGSMQPSEATYLRMNWDNPSRTQKASRLSRTFPGSCHPMFLFSLSDGYIHGFKKNIALHFSFS